MSDWKDKFPQEDRYYETQNGVLYCGNALSILREFPVNSVDLIITDPSYGVTQNPLDKRIDPLLLWNLFKRVRKDNGIVIVFGQGLFFYELCLANKKEYRYDLVWDKVLPSGFLNANRMPLRQHELIAVFYKKFSKYNPQFWEGTPSHPKGKAHLTKQNKNRNYSYYKPIDNDDNITNKKYPRSIIRIQKPHPSKALHPTQKPVELFEYLIKTYSNENDLILDPFVGSGTMAVACEKLKRRWIGIELNSDYCAIAKERIIGTLNKE